MRKLHQKQILDVLSSLKEAQKAGLFADCQDGAISIGEFIEEEVGEGTKTVNLLEEYCELVYQASIGNENKKVLDDQIKKIEKSIKTELEPNRTEMIFLSYKASMSDSIMSIYQAAKEDPSCDAYWMPIPYYERNPDLTLGRMYFEGAEFYPENIECTDWKKYNIEERRPDAIFTFSPYDDKNFVTSIHPDFYCKRLRELTDMLVYVPYFVCTEDIKLDFTQSDGVLYSHKTIVQSEPVRQRYIEGYTRFDEEGHSRKIYGEPEEKIIALGSPKFDAVINAKPEDYELPESWKSLIFGDNKTSNKIEDKTKKVVFYNTSIASIIMNGAKFLRKLIYVLQEFSKAEDLVLWWRPHPLSETTMKSMSPELLETYKKIVNEYKRSGVGIYDDTPDLHRAIAWCDAFYGDWSSIALLYKVLGRICVFQDVDKTDDVIVETVVNIKDYYERSNVWFFDNSVNVFEVFSDIVTQRDISLNNDMLSEIAVNLDGTAGKTIYNYVKEALIK